MNAVIRATSGPLRGALFRLVEDEVTVGRQHSNHLCIGDVSVSRFHCTFKVEDGRYKVQDLKSHNGTLVNGKAIEEAYLSSGDLITIGDTTFEFSEDAGSPPGLAVSIADRETIAGLRIEAMPVASSKVTVSSSSPLQILQAIGNLLNSAKSTHELDLRILDAICNSVGAQRAAIFMARGGEWVVVGWDQRQGRCDPAFANREIADHVFKCGTSMTANLEQTSTSVIALPLVIRDKVSGVMYLERGADSPPFTHCDIELLQALVNFEAVALDYSHTLEQLEAENLRMRTEVHLRHEMIGQSSRMKEVYRRIARIAPTDATVLIRGETGTGKELAARAIHENSPRARQPFAAINCALLKGDLLESELFGHEKGAFTGAVAQKKGKLETANGGTVFLDELAELPEAPQSMLLRVLQEHAFQRLGGTSTIRVDIRIIAATNRNLEEAVRAGDFRQDLYFRLNVVSVRLPPLRERRDDIPLLVEHFLHRATRKNKRVVTGVSAEAMVYLEGYDWPGNVRELENAVEHAIVFGVTAHIMPEDLPEPILERIPKTRVLTINYQEAVRNAKKRIVSDALEQANGDHSKAAELLRIHPNNLYRLIRDLEVRPEHLDQAV